MLALFVPLFVIFMAYRQLRHKFNSRSLEDERHLQLLEVRRLQQESYGRTSYDDYDSDSDSVDEADFVNDAVVGGTADVVGGEKEELAQGGAVAEGEAAEAPLVQND